MPACKDPEKEKERRRKLSEGRTGEKNWNFGKKFTDAHKRKMSESGKGRVFTPEWKEKLRQARLGKKASLETRMKMSDSKTGEKNAFFGKTHSQETKDYISKWRIDNGISAGKNNPGYIDGSSYRPYCEKFTPEFKRRVRAFFNNTCQRCGHIHLDGEPELTVHHVNYRKDACCNKEVTPLFAAVCSPVKGGISCHGITSHDRDYWEICFTQLIRNKYDGKCYFTKEEYYRR